MSSKQTDDHPRVFGKESPAVENQTTGRMFRFGQKRTVFVHQSITKNSFEEKFDVMSAAAGEFWITRISHKVLYSYLQRPAMRAAPSAESMYPSSVSPSGF